VARSILFVDDEENILRSLRRCFFETQFDVYFANSADDAYPILDENRIDMVISDMRMPGADGYEFLTIIKERYPHIVRIILSGYSDKEQLLKTLNNGIVKAYLYKPWDNDELITQLEHYFEIYEQLEESGIEEVINKISTLPVLSSTYHKFISLIEKQAEVSEIAKVIVTSPAYTVNLLKLANSAIYSLSTSSVKHALVCLGVVVVKDIIMTTEVFLALKVSDPKLEFEYNAFVKHSEISNVVFHKLYQKNFGDIVPEEFETVCLLHDIGKLVILHFFPEEYKVIMKRRGAEPEKSILEIEKEVIGVNHGQIGAYLIDWWNLPLTLQEVALYHHTPIDEKVFNKDIMKLVMIADEIAGKLIHDSKELILPEAIFEDLTLTVDQACHVLNLLRDNEHTM